MSNEDETIQRMSATIQENIRELLKQDDEIKSLQSERDRLREALENIVSLDISTNKNSFEDDFIVCVSIASNALARKDGKDGE